MQVILTHENADFDAVASLLGAHKLFPEALPVLPRRVNKNCRDFLALYGAGLPLTDPEDVPRGRIRRVILVDTQSLTSLRGMGPRPEVHVIDHHEFDHDAHPDWSFGGDLVGATTTLLVEELSRRALPLTRIEATLLLIGIYEDTGRLSYLSTTPRDLHAAGWLLERGASLEAADEFLDPPLTPGQRVLYEQLIEDAVVHRVSGHSVVVAVGRLGETEEEISTLAHKLRELFEPSALFILVALNDHVQLVARSATDDIDVSDVAERLGGGGHARAAAALVRERPLESVRAELENVLDTIVRPAVTVAQIMSHGVQVLAPETPVAEAGDRMRRTGHEGYPVVEEGRVIGLLTRRAVDRALQFHMENEPVRQVMEPGSYHVAPGDPVKQLQRLMIESGWGQIPVVDDRRILGVVTRTDLIALWGAPPARTARAEIQSRLEEALDEHTLALVRRIAHTAQEMGYRLYFVGGLVRDLLLGADVVDVDLVVEGDAIPLARRLAHDLGGRIVAHKRFGTAKWLLGPETWQAAVGRVPDTAIEAVDFATARTEFYTHPTALPEVARSSIKQDLHRRDFTINTLAIRLDPPRWGELLDFYGGEADLREGVIRVLHSFSFVDDPTRILRAARLETRLGFHLDPRSEELIANALPLLDRVSGERIRHELDLILAEAAPERALCRLESLGALTRIHPALHCDRWVNERFRAAREKLEPSAWDLAPGDLAFIYWALLIYRIDAELVEQLAERLRIPRTDADDLLGLLELRRVLARLGRRARPSQIVGALEPFPARTLATAWVAQDRSAVRQRLVRFQTDYRHVGTDIKGDDLKALGLAPGPLFGELLGQLRDARLDGKVSTRAEEEALLQRLLKT